VEARWLLLRALAARTGAALDPDPELTDVA
jgi:hypothetical protein